jgi:hypothetical protein
MRGAEWRVLALAATALLAGTARAEELRPFEVSYNWSWHGFTVAHSELKLTQRDAQTWVYSSVSEPRGIGHLFPYHPVLTSVVRITDAGVVPLTFNATAGSTPTKRDVHVTYDWNRGRVTGTYEDTQMDMQLLPTTQDEMSVQVALIYELLRGRTPEHFLMLDKHAVRQYVYARDHQETLDTSFGRVVTTLFNATKQYSKRITKFWCDPTRGYLPVRVQQVNEGNIEWSLTMQTIHIHREQAAPQP